MFSEGISFGGKVQHEQKKKKVIVYGKIRVSKAISGMP